MRPDTVRQTVERLLDRFRHLAEDDPYIAPLAGPPLLALAAA